MQTQAQTQAFSQDIWDAKYRLKTRAGEPKERDIDSTFRRVAKALAAMERPKLQAEWEGKFLWAMRNGAIPGGRITANAGAQEHKPATALINCTVAGHLPDSMSGILGSVHAAGVTLQSGAGIGYCFSTLRPKGAFVSGAGSTTSGPLPFMDVFDAMCKTVSSAGGRRGAQMATFDVAHPDVLDFIQAKRETGRLRHFNLSLLITAEFIEAVKNDRDWKLVFPTKEREVEAEALDLNNPDQVIWREWPTDDGYISREDGKVACKVYRTIPARELWETIMKSTYDFAEPGFILIDEVNEMNNLWWAETITATNPCGEQPLPEFGSCLLGSLNLTQFVNEPFTVSANFDLQKFQKVVRVFTRMLDNVADISGLPLEAQRQEMARKRRHGMGYFGLGSMMAMLGIKYGSPDSVRTTEEITKYMALIGWVEGIALAKEKGPAPIMEEEFEVTARMLLMRPEMARDNFRVGDKVKGKVLHARYSRYMQRIGGVRPDLIEQIAEMGSRFTHHTSIAPTGTIPLAFGNNASNGIEPSFSHSYMRNVIKGGKKTKEQSEVMSYEYLAYRELHPEATPETLPACFATADNVPPEQHVNVQAAAQKWVDSAISKTINVPSDFPYEKFKGIYLYAVSKGLKGCTTFRFNPEAFGGVLVKKDDLANTTYRFTLEDGSTVEVKGNEQVEYDGEIHNAANLFDALKEGTYGKF